MNTQFTLGLLLCIVIKTNKAKTTKRTSKTTFSVIMRCRRLKRDDVYNLFAMAIIFMLILAATVVWI